MYYYMALVALIVA